ncbi:hypothetical protein ACHAQJ_009322 [Trichoderma viride]
MATVTAEDIRTVAERVRAAEEIVAPYQRREPYDFEVLEPLMKMLPKERVPYDPRPQRSDETDREYHLVWRHHFNIWLLQKINDYFKVKGGRLLSPSSDIDDDDDERAHEALRNQEKVIRGMNIVDWDYFNIPMEYDKPEDFEIPPEFWEGQLSEPRGKELPNISSEDIDASRSGNGGMASSSSSPQGPGRYSRNLWRSTKDGAGPAAEQQEMDGSVLYPSIEQSTERPQRGNEMEASRPSSTQNAEPTQIRKRKRRSLPFEDNALEIPSKKQRTDKHPQLSTTLDTAGFKRKRDGEEPLDKPSSTGEPGQPSDKKRRLDAEWKIQPSQKRKRGSQENDEEVPETKRRRVSKAEVTDAEQSAQDAPTAAGSGRTLATAPSLRITRARRRRLSGEDAQLLQLDQRGKPDVQEPKHAAQEPARELSVTSQNGRQPKKAAGMDVKNSRKTKTTNTTKASMKASTMASTTVNTTKTIARTRFRSASSKTRGKGQLSSI